MSCSDREKRHDEISKAINKSLLGLIAFSFFSALTLVGQQDRSLLASDATIKLPFADTAISFRAFLIVGPLVLAAFSLYLHIYVGYWTDLSAHRLTPSQRVSPTQPARLPFVFNLEGWVPWLLSKFLMYWLVPGVLVLYTYKALPRPESPWLIFFTGAIIWLFLLLQLRRRSERSHRIGSALLWLLFFVSTYLMVCAGSDLGPAFRAWDFRKGAHLVNRRLSLGKEDLRKLDLNLVDMSGADLREADLTGANLSGSHLREADLRGAKLTGASLDDIHLEKANLEEQHIEKANLSSAHLNGAKLQDVDLKQTILDHADLESADLQNAHLEGADFMSADLRETNLERSQLDRANLSDLTDGFRADLNGASLKDATLEDPHFREAHFEMAHLEKALLEGTDLEGAHMEGCYLQYASVWMGNLEGAHLKGAHLEGTDLPATVLKDADLTGADLTAASFHTSGLADAVGLTQGQLDKACFTQGKQPPRLPSGLRPPPAKADCGR